MMLKPLLTRRASRKSVRRVARLLVALPGILALGPMTAIAQGVPTDFGRFTGPSSPGSNAPGGMAPGLYVQVTDGLIQLSNPGGTQQFTPGQFGFMPVLALAPPVVVPVNPGLVFTPPPIFQQPSTPAGPPGISVVAPTPPVVTPPVATTPDPLKSGPRYALFNWGSDGLGYLGVGNATFNAQSWLTNFTGSAMPFSVNSAVTVADVGQLDDLGWGRWTSGSISDHGEAFDVSTWKSGMPYVVGRPTTDANLPVSGSMTYSLAGATKAIDMATGAVGTLSGSLTIDFQNARYNVTPNLNVAMAAGPTYVTGSGMTQVGPDGARATFSTVTQNVTGGACAGSSCTFSTQGVLTGAAANNAGIVYSLTGPDVRVTGAAGFKR
ncbi:hypothetical protein PBR20603_04247 [Pandoraea bronchicola]|uniref:Uncharacterized protein n=2 Tax=Pandoraea bronchicola TaxID=2508287 RepID=A0A5E5BY55_9BURK|nr:hypothetical protein PBR20603_04247 [Pandoraea bronchicola]